VYRHDLYLFYFIVYLQQNGDALPKNYKRQPHIHSPVSKHEEEII